MIRTRDGRLYKAASLQIHKPTLELHVLPELGAARSSTSRRFDVQDFVDGLIARDLKPTTVQCAVLALRAIYGRLVERCELAVNLTSRLKLPKVRRARDRIRIRAFEEARQLLVWDCANADGTSVRQVGTGDRIRYNAAWSPDGTKLTFVQDNGSAGSGDVYTMTTSGGGLTRLTSSSTWDGMPDWAPDGSRIAYTCISGGRAQLCLMTPSGGSKTVLTKSLKLPAAVKRISWSPTSLSLAFSTEKSGGFYRFYRIARTGTSLRLIATVIDGLWGPAWSPDANYIAFMQYGDAGAWTLAAVNSIDGSGWREIGGGENDMRLDPSGWQALR
jgi:Tol biopolymer transport system component